MRAVSVTFEMKGGVILECMSVLLFEIEWILYEIVANWLKQIAFFKIVNGSSLYFSVQWRLTWHLTTCHHKLSDITVCLWNINIGSQMCCCVS